MITLTILSPGGTLCSAQVEKVSFPGAKGLFTVYPEHAPLLSSLLPGTIEWTAIRSMRRCSPPSFRVQ